MARVFGYRHYVPVPGTGTGSANMPVPVPAVPAREHSVLGKGSAMVIALQMHGTA